MADQVNSRCFALDNLTLQVGYPNQNAANFMVDSKTVSVLCQKSALQIYVSHGNSDETFGPIKLLRTNHLMSSKAPQRLAKLQWSIESWVCIYAKYLAGHAAMR